MLRNYTVDMFVLQEDLALRRRLCLM